MDYKCKKFTDPNDCCIYEHKQKYLNSTNKKEKHRLIKLLIIALLDELDTDYEYERPICNTCKHEESNHSEQHESLEHKHYEESSSSSSTWQEKHNPSSKSKHTTFEETSHTPVLNDINPMKLLEQFDMNNLSQLSELINLMSIGGKLNSIMHHQISPHEGNMESSSSSDDQNYVESSRGNEDLKHQESSSGYGNLEPNHCSQHNHHDVESSSFEEKNKRDKKVKYENKPLQGKIRARKRRKFD